MAQHITGAIIAKECSRILGPDITVDPETLARVSGGDLSLSLDAYSDRYIRPVLFRRRVPADLVFHPGDLKLSDEAFSDKYRKRMSYENVHSGAIRAVIGADLGI